MRSFAAFALPVAFAAIASAGSVPAGEAVPQDLVATVKEGSSYIVKLGCLGCPFQVRHDDGEIVTSSSVGVENSLLLNVTVDNAYPAILLNGHPVVPLGQRPPTVQALQIPADTPADAMSKIAASNDQGSGYAPLQLQYEHTLLGTDNHNEEWLQFDVTGIIRPAHIPSVYSLTHDNQRVLQLLFRRQRSDDQTTTLSIVTLELVEHNDRHAPILMKCGKPAMIQTEFNPLEWDYYGKIGTWSRTFAQVSSRTFRFVESNALVLVVLVVVLGLYKFVVTWRMVAQRRAEAAMAKEQQDVEFALLTSPDFDDDEDEEYDAPPDYGNVPALEARKEDEM